MEKKRSDIIDLRPLIEDYRTHWYWFLISVAFCGILAFVFVKMKNEVYAVRANVLIEEEDKSLPGFDMGNLFGGGSSVDDEVFVMSAHSLYKNVARELGLEKNHLVYTSLLGRKVFYEKFPVEVKTPPLFSDTASVALTFKVSVSKDGLVDALVKYPSKRETLADIEDARFPVEVDTRFGKFVIDSTAYYVPGEKVKTLITLFSYDGAAENMDEDVFVSIASKKSQVLTLGINIDDPKFGKKILNTIVKNYNLRGINEKQQEGIQTIEFLDKRIAMLALDLDSAEVDIQTYKEGLGITDVATEAGINLSVKNKLHAEVLAAETELEILKLTRDFLRDDKNDFSLIPYSSDAPGVGTGISAYNEVILQRMNLITNAKPDNIVLKQLDERINAMRGNISATLDKAIENSELALKDAKSEMNRAQSKLSGVPLQERLYRGKHRQQSLTQQLYLYLLQRREETAIVLANAVPKGVIIDEAFTLQDPVSTSKKIIFAMALILGLILPPIVLYIKKLFRTKFSTRDELRALTDIPIIGEVCLDKSGNTLVVGPNNTSSSAELFRLIRSNLQFVMNGTDDKVVLMTSTNSGEGKSFISINLAASLALLGKKVVLVGMDIRNPRLAEYLGLPSHTGLTQYLADSSITVDKIVMHDAIAKNLDIIQAGPVPPNPSELLQSQRVEELFKELRELYDFIIVDSAPVGMVSDTFSLARISDATIYICRANYTSVSDIRFANSVMADKRLSKMSLVINGTATRKGYGYGYGREHSRK